MAFGKERANARRNGGDEMLFGNLFHNYMYGKAGKGDFKISDLPANRFQLFRTTLGVRWSAMVGINMLYALIWLPTFLWTLLNYSVVANAIEDGQEFMGYVTIYLLGLIVTVGITGPFAAGISYVTRNWARDQHSFVLSDYWDAVKGNWKQAIGVSLITGFMPFLAYISYVTYGQQMANSVIFVVPLILVFLVILIWILSLKLVYTMMVTYELSFMSLLRNSMLITIARLPFALGIQLAGLWFPALAVALMFIFPGIDFYLMLAWILYFGLFGLAFNRMLYASYANAQCEKYLNTRIEGAQTNIGLRPENWDDTEYIPEDDEK